MNFVKTLITSGIVIASPVFSETSVVINDSLTTTAENLKPGGVHYSITHTEGDFEKLVDGVISLLSKNIKNLGAEGRAVMEMIPKMLELSGYYSMSSRGSSVTALPGEAWHNRSFFGHNGRRGVYTLLGEKPQDWQAPAYATADADAVLELQIDTRQLLNIADAVIALFPPEPRAKAAAEKAKEMEKPLFPGSPMSFEQVLNAANIRASLALTLDQSVTWKPQGSGPELPNFDVIARLDGVAPLMPLFDATIGKMAAKQEIDGLVHFTTPAAIPAPFGKIQPTIVHDPKNDALWVRLKASPLDAIASQENSLLTSPTFQKAIADFPAKGNALFYISDEFLALIQGVIKQKPNMEPEIAAIIDGVAAKVRETQFGITAAIASKDEGFLLTTNLPIALKGGSFLSGPIGIASLSSLATPAVIQARKKASIINKFKK